MNTLVLSISIVLSLNNYPSGHTVNLDMPSGLAFGHTLVTDLNPDFISNEDDLLFFSANYDAHFNQLGFLKELVIDRDKKHALPENWGLTWNTGLATVKKSFSSIEGLQVVTRDVSKSSTMSSLVDVFFTADQHTYHLYFVDWTDETKLDGFSFVRVTPIK